MNLIKPVYITFDASGTANAYISVLLENIRTITVKAISQSFNPSALTDEIQCYITSNLVPYDGVVGYVNNNTLYGTESGSGPNNITHSLNLQSSPIQGSYTFNIKNFDGTTNTELLSFLLILEFSQ